MGKKYGFQQLQKMSVQREIFLYIFITKHISDTPFFSADYKNIIFPRIDI